MMTSREFNSVPLQILIAHSKYTFFVRFMNLVFVFGGRGFVLVIEKASDTQFL